MLSVKLMEQLALQGCRGLKRLRGAKANELDCHGERARETDTSSALVAALDTRFMSRLGSTDLARSSQSGRAYWTRETAGYCTFLLLKNPEYAEQYANKQAAAGDERHRVERKTKRKLHATKEYINQNRRELWVYLYHRELRREAMEASLDKAGLTGETAAMVRAAHFGKESQYLRLRRVRTSLKEFTILARLGKGGYGQVYLCRKVDTGEILALKQMKKSRFTDKNEVHRVKKEREVMTKTNSIWLARLKYCFQSQHYLYMAMEYIPGGDLKTLLDHMTALDENDARFLFAEMLLCVDALHQLGYIHRDLKPDNFMIDRNGHLKLIDFGLSKEAASEKLNTSRAMKRRHSAFRVGTWSKNNTTLTVQPPKSRNKHRKVFSVVGSPEYMALEILNQEGYSNLVDYWSLGVILFEFIFGYTPFGAETVAGVFENIQNHKNRVVRPPRDADEDSEEVSDACWDLITKLISPASQRIGKTGISEITLHPWFADFDWNAIREMEPPFIPNLESENDTSYFPAEEPMAQAGLEELEADLDHLISKQLARSSEGNSMEAVFDHRTKKSGEISLLSPISSKGESPVPTLSKGSNPVDGTSPSPTLLAPSVSPLERTSSRHSSKGRRGSSKRESPIPAADSPSLMPPTTSSPAMSLSGRASPPAQSPLPAATTEHPKLKFNQSYSKFDFAGFTFKHEDFAILDSSPREVAETRERSNSTVDLDSMIISSSSSSHLHAPAATQEPFDPASIRLKAISSPISSPRTDGSQVPAAGNVATSPQLHHHCTEPGSAIPPHMLSHSSLIPSASGSPSSSTSSSSKRAHSNSPAPDAKSSSKHSSPAKSSKSRGAVSSNPLAHTTALPYGHEYNSGNEESMLGEPTTRLSRTNTVTVLHYDSTPSIQPPVRPQFDSIRHAESTPVGLSSKKSKGDDIDSLKRRLTRLKKPSDVLGDSGNSSNDDMPPLMAGSQASLHSSDSSFGSREDPRFPAEEMDIISIVSPTGTTKKKRKESGTLKKIQGLFEKLNFVTGSSKNSPSDSPSSHHSGSGSSPHIVISTKGTSTPKATIISPRDRPHSQTSASPLSSSAVTSPIIPSVFPDDTVQSPVVTRSRSGTTGEPPLPAQLYPDFIVTKARHKSEGKRSKRTSSRSEIVPTPPETPSASITMITSPGMKKKRHSSSKRSSVASDASRPNVDPYPTETPSLHGVSMPGTSGEVSLATEQQIRKERLLALARAFQESQANTSSSNQPGSASPPAVPIVGSSSAVSSGRSSPRFPSPFKHESRDSLDEPTPSRSHRGSEGRKRRGSSGTPTRKPISSRLSSIDPLEEASNEATPQSTPEKLGKSTTPPATDSKAKEKDKKDKSQRVKSHSRQNSAEPEGPITSPQKKTKDKSSLKDSKGPKSSKHG